MNTLLLEWDYDEALFFSGQPNIRRDELNARQAFSVVVLRPSLQAKIERELSAELKFGLLNYDALMAASRTSEAQAVEGA